jgi:class 3 adenylate cyclase
LGVLDAPETRFVMTDDGLQVAYQVVGEGPVDLLFASEWWFHLDAQWEDPLVSRFLRRLAAFSRLILFDRRGFGLSDPMPSGDTPTLDALASDLIAVLDAASVERAFVLATGDGAPVSLLMAAGHPRRVAALAIVNGFARLSVAPDYRHGLSDRAQQAIFRQIEERWGFPHPVRFIAPSLADDRDFQQFFARAARQSTTRAGAMNLTSLDFEMDVRPVLSSVRVPTLVVHRSGDRYIPPAHGQYLAEHLPNARYVEVAGEDHLWWLGDIASVIDEIEEFVTGSPATTKDEDRVLATVVFTDIVGSTVAAAELGDQRWRELLDAHDQIVRRQLARYQGREIKTLGDGFLAVFDSPTRAVRCAQAIAAAVRPLGISVRAGVHTGEVELRGDDVGGIGVHIGQRVASHAQADQVVVSSTVTDLVVGSSIRFSQLGEHDLRGVPGTWHLYSVDS